MHTAQLEDNWSGMFVLFLRSMLRLGHVDIEDFPNVWKRTNARRYIYACVLKISTRTLQRRFRDRVFERDKSPNPRTSPWGTHRNNLKLIT